MNSEQLTPAAELAAELQELKLIDENLAAELGHAAGPSRDTRPNAYGTQPYQFRALGKISNIVSRWPEEIDANEAMLQILATLAAAERVSE